MKKRHEFALRESKFQNKKAWNPDKEEIFNELQQLKEKYNKLLEENTQTFARANKYEVNYRILERDEKLFKDAGLD